MDFVRVICYTNNRGDSVLALVTGGTSGIGLEIAKNLDKKGYDLVLVSEKSDIDKSIFKNNVEIINLDLSKKENCYKLHDMVKDVDVFINNAGFGIFGEFNETSLDKELDLIDKSKYEFCIVNDFPMFEIKDFAIFYKNSLVNHILY